MIENKPESFSDVVDRAAAELRSMPVPPGPPPELLEVLLHAANDNVGCVKHTVKASDKPLSDVSYNQPLSQLQKIRNIIMKNPFKSLTTVAVCCLVIIAAFLILGPLPRGSVAFAEVAAIIQKAKTMVCTGEMNLPWPDTMGKTKIKIMSLENGRMRQEMGSQMVMIMDFPTGKSLTLNPKTKSAVLLNIKGMPKSALQQDYLTQFKEIAQNPKAEDLGLKIMDGKEVKGFRVKIENFTVTFWADPQSGDPITVEYQYHMPDMSGFLNKETTKLIDKEIPKLAEFLKKNPKTAEALKEKSPDAIKKELQQHIPDVKKEIQKQFPKGGKTMKMVLSNFQFDVPLDESLFSLTPPEGYTLQEMSMDFSGSGVKDVIEVLRRAADMDNGAFPDSITGMSLMMKLMTPQMMKWSFQQGVQAAKDRAEGKEPKKPSPPKMPPEMLKQQSEIASLVGRMNLFLQENEGWKYAGKGLKRGDAQTPIFWYVPKDSQQGRVIYGDLSVRDVPVDQLPPDPEMKKSDTK